MGVLKTESRILVSGRTELFEDLFLRSLQTLYNFARSYGIDYLIQDKISYTIPQALLKGTPFWKEGDLQRTITRPYFTFYSEDEINKNIIYSTIDDYVIRRKIDDVKMDVAKKFKEADYGKNAPKKEALEFLLNEYSPSIFLMK